LWAQHTGVVSNHVNIFEQNESILCGPSISKCSMAHHYQNVNMMTVGRCHYSNFIWNQAIISISLYKLFSIRCRHLHR
jgi:ribosomal protein S27AE